MNILDIHYILFNLPGYPVSFVEFAGTLSGLACVYLTAKEKVICWPVGIVNIVFFFIMFYQVRLYSDMLLQVYFLITTIYGWWRWTHPADLSEKDAKDELKISDISFRGMIILLAAAMGAVLVLGRFMRSVHILLPAFFPEKAAYPYADAFTTVLSIIAQIIMAMKKRQCWLLWIAVDCVATVVYFLKGINLVAVEYIVFGLISASGYITWTRLKKGYTVEEAEA